MLEKMKLLSSTCIGRNYMIKRNKNVIYKNDV